MKGHRFCLESLSPLIIENTETIILVSGDTHEFGQEITAFAKTLPGSRQIRFLGSQADMIPFYAACDVICVPSSSEPFGRTVIEAMAVGVPVVATRVGGIPEIVDTDEVGTLVDYGDRQALRAAVAKLLEIASWPRGDPRQVGGRHVVSIA